MRNIIEAAQATRAVADSIEATRIIASACYGRLNRCARRLRDHLAWRQPSRRRSTWIRRYLQRTAVLLPPSAIRLHRDPRLPADLLDPRPFLRLAQDERNPLLAELRPLHGLFPTGPMKTYPRIFPQSVVQVPGSRSGYRGQTGQAELARAVAALAEVPGLRRA